MVIVALPLLIESTFIVTFDDVPSLNEPFLVEYFKASPLCKRSVSFAAALELYKVDLFFETSSTNAKSSLTLL